MSTAVIAALFDQWNTALQSGDAEQVAALYAPDSVLLPTMSNTVRHNRIDIAEYFTHFCAKKPVGKIDQSHIRIYDKIAIHAGVYSFICADGTAFQARFSFVYHLDKEQWLIVEHHSSYMPEG